MKRKLCFCLHLFAAQKLGMLKTQFGADEVIAPRFELVHHWPLASSAEHSPYIHAP